MCPFVHAHSPESRPQTSPFRPVTPQLSDGAEPFRHYAERETKLRSSFLKRKTVGLKRPTVAVFVARRCNRKRKKTKQFFLFRLHIFSNHPDFFEFYSEKYLNNIQTNKGLSSKASSRQ